ncbi:hypothetical protein GWI33_000747 [Rhynchophorus ferrugineus]|uniref:Uncharacterized protein n=1 Tax=Rhynchophorus ferrugineus TaxID=354439 RepID=A0A834M214_RHYFE|nr:hypothetical protein GWI33_000747 [Rhynchophorus ferrugineus]
MNADAIDIQAPTPPTPHPRHDTKYKTNLISHPLIKHFLLALMKCRQCTQRDRHRPELRINFVTRGDTVTARRSAVRGLDHSRFWKLHCVTVTLAVGTG